MTPQSEIYLADIKRVRAGDIAAAQVLMRHCAEALRELLLDGRNNLANPYAYYLAEVLDRLAKSDSTARLFCLDMPKHRPKRHDVWSRHLERNRKFKEALPDAKSQDAAIRVVAAAVNVSPGAIRASLKKTAFVRDAGVTTVTTESAKRQESKKTQPLRANDYAGVSSAAWGRHRGGAEDDVLLQHRFARSSVRRK